MTDGQVLDAVAAAKRAYKSAETIANRRFTSAKKHAEQFFGNDDVERAAKHNALKRAEAELIENLNRAKIRFIDRLEFIRERAKQWADLVPMVR